MNNYDLWKWAAGKRTEKNKNETYSAKNWWYVLLIARCICRDHVVVLFNLCALELRENRQMRN